MKIIFQVTMIQVNHISLKQMVLIINDAMCEKNSAVDPNKCNQLIDEKNCAVDAVDPNNYVKEKNYNIPENEQIHVTDGAMNTNHILHNMK